MQSERHAGSSLEERRVLRGSCSDEKYGAVDLDVYRIGALLVSPAPLGPVGEDG